MVAVALDKSLQQSEVLIVDTCQTVLVDDQYTLPVADVELCRSGGVMGRAIGITAQLLMFQPSGAVSASKLSSRPVFSR